MREYAQAVYASTDAYVASLKPEDLDQTVEIFGQKRSLGNFLGAVMATHIGWHTGEVSCVKGLQGAKGYPF